MFFFRWCMKIYFLDDVWLFISSQIIVLFFWRFWRWLFRWFLASKKCLGDVLTIFWNHSHPRCEELLWIIPVPDLPCSTSNLYVKLSLWLIGFLGNWEAPTSISKPKLKPPGRPATTWNCRWWVVRRWRVVRWPLWGYAETGIQKPWLLRVYRGLYYHYTTQLCVDYNDPLWGSLLNNQYTGK